MALDSIYANGIHISFPPGVLDAGEVRKLIRSLRTHDGGFSHNGTIAGVLAAHIETTEDLKTLLAFFSYDAWFWRALDPKYWTRKLTADNWMACMIGATRGLVRPDSFGLNRELTDDEVGRLFEIATGPTAVTVMYPEAPKAALFAKLATTPAQVTALCERCDAVQSIHVLMAPFTNEQIAWAKDALLASTATPSGDYYVAKKWRIARFFFLTRTRVTPADIAAVAALRAGALFEAPYEDALVLPAVANARANLSAAVDGVRGWVETQLGEVTAVPLTDDFWLMWAAAVHGPDDELVARVGKLLDDKKGDFRAERSRKDLARVIGRMLVCRADGDAVLDALRARTKSKGLHELLELARGVLAGALGAIGRTAIAWAYTAPARGAALIREAADPRALVTEAMAATTTATEAVHLAASVLRYVIAAPQQQSPLSPMWPFALDLLRWLERVVDDTAPAKLCDGAVVDEELKYTLERTGELYARDSFVSDLRALRDASTNKRFGGLLAGAIGESHGEKLQRLARQLAGHRSGTVTRRYASRTTTPVHAGDINRLYGSPIGVTRERWPVGPKGPMHHLLTLETRALSDEARKELGDAAAVAVFMTSRSEPNAPMAVIALTRAELATETPPVVAPEQAGVRLDVLEIAMPNAVFKGGKKSGALLELRTALDRLDGVVATDATSPRWIQEPEPTGGALVVQLDHGFAPETSFGDCGALYVFTDDVVFQCH